MPPVEKKRFFSRYRADNKDDFKEFKKLLRTFQKYLPLPEEPDLATHVDYFYDQCLGCIGMLKSWLYRTLAAALEGNQPTITPALWKKHTEAPGTLLSMFDEISCGEDDFWEQKDESHLEDLRKKLRARRKPNPSEKSKKAQETPKETNPPPASQSEPSANKDSTPTPPTQSDSSSKEDPPAPLVKPPKRNNKRVGLPNPVRRPVG